MVPGQTQSSWRRFGLTYSMVLVFLASVAAAAWLADVRAEPMDRGADTMQALRRELPRLWSGPGETLWYLLTGPSGQQGGWLMQDWRREDGTYAGRTITRTQNDLYVEQWRVSDDARKGTYLAWPWSDRRDRTAIALDGNTVVVEQDRGRRRRIARAPTPANYIPEGLSSLAVRLACVGGSSARFAMIYNDEAISGGRLAFGALAVEPQSPRRARVSYLPATSPDWTDVVVLDEKGRIVERHNLRTGLTYRLADLEQVRRLYPEAGRFAGPAGETQPTRPAGDEPDAMDEQDESDAP